MNRSRKLTKALFSAAIFVSLLCVFAASAAAASMSANPVYVKEGRLFEIELRLSGDSVMTAATFTFTYDKSRIAYREVTTELNGASVESLDTNGTLRTIFLSPGGVDLAKNRVVIKAKFKAIAPGESRVEIAASDCVDGKVGRMKPPERITCAVSASENPDSRHSSRKSTSQTSSRHSGSGSGKNGSGYNLYETDSVTKPMVVSAVKNGENKTSIRIASAVIVAIIASALIIALVFLSDRRRREKLRKAEEDRLIDKDKD